MGIISVTEVKWIWKTGWPIAIPPAVACGLGKETVLPSVRSGDSEHLSFFTLWKENSHRGFQLSLVRNMLANAGQDRQKQKPPETIKYCQQH